MRSPFQQGVRSSVWSVLIFMIAILAASSCILAQTHVVSSSELHQQVLEASRARTANIQKLSELMTSSKAEKALHLVHMDAKQVRAAMSNLSDEELAQLGARATKAQADFAAGDLSDRDLLIILVGIAALILIIVAVR